MPSTLEDIFAIQQNAALYTSRANALDATGMMDAFTEDAQFLGLAATMGLGDVPIDKATGIRDFFAPTFANLEYLQQHSAIAEIKVNGDTATARTTFTEFAKLQGGPLLMMMGTNEDVLVRQGDRWRFKTRKLTTKKLTALAELPLG